ncbi:MAG TPA: hypothetical protein VN181_14205, partial [Thermoanaerobaculia bacterium]|nr:hypothetical protein [Thermoanaerobaculia bacterium]
ELRNPGVDTATNAPKLLVKMAVKGKATTGQNVKFDSPAAEMAAQELKGVPGHYAVGASIPLASFRPGDYTLTMKVTDQVKNQTYDLDGTFKVVAPEK